MHEVESFFEASSAQALAQERKGAVALAVAHLEQRHAVAQQGRMDVTPPTPLVSVYGEERSSALVGAQRRDKRVCCFANQLCRHAGLLQGEEVGNDSAVGGDPLIRFGGGRQGFLDVVWRTTLGEERSMGT